MRLFFIQCLVGFFSRLPLGLNRFIAAGIGRLIYLLNVRERKTTERNLELCFPKLSPSERAALARKSICQSASWALETSSVWFRGEDWRESRIKKIHNRDLYDQAKSSNQGVLLLLPHFGNWEMIGLWVGDQSKTTAMYRMPKMEKLDPLVRQARSYSELTSMVPATARGVMSVLKALKRGEQTIILPDQVPVGEGGVYSEFFGIPAYTQTLTFNLIQKTSPIVLFAYALRVPGGFELGFFEPPEGIYSENAQDSVDAMNRGVEQLCLMDLSQYQWEYKRFKNQADGKDYYL
jgi:KDO2-lipid IV(A) lauroyltransferase